MKKITIITVVLGSFLALGLQAAYAQTNLGNERGTRSKGHQFKLRVDPQSGVIDVLGGDRTVINSNFAVNSVGCPNCVPPCPPYPRSVAIELQATAAVAANYGVSNLTSSNYTVTDVSYSRRDALTIGELVTVTITGDVLECDSNFNVFFDMCDSPQPNPADSCLATARTMTLLHSFLGGANDGRETYSQRPVIAGSTLYGMTRGGGDLGLGTIFSVNADGTAFTLLHEFTGGGADGMRPLGSLTLAGSTLYGMTYQGGDTNFGTIFSVNTDGTGFTLLHEFVAGVADGARPYGHLTLAGSTLYGMTQNGGDSNMGTVFSISTDGTAFTLLHEFTGGGADGKTPYASLSLAGSTLYGMTGAGGDSDMGVVFSISTDGTAFTLLHEFTGGGADGQQPLGSLTLHGSTLFGMTRYGGDSNHGTIFSVNTGGTAFTLLREFAGTGVDGRFPYGSLTLAGSTLYGMTSAGGGSDMGVLFSISIDGNWFGVLHEFAGASGDGRFPYFENPLVVGSTVYGMTYLGGASNAGALFKFD